MQYILASLAIKEDQVSEYIIARIVLTSYVILLSISLS
jgi:hypothetical protein